MISYTEKELISTPMVANMRVTGRNVKEMDIEFLHVQAEQSMKALLEDTKGHGVKGSGGEVLEVKAL